MLWHDQYIKSAAELCQWGAIAECVIHRPASAWCIQWKGCSLRCDFNLRSRIICVMRRYARQADNCQLQMDSLWRLGDWDALKRHVLPRAQVSPLM